MNKTALRYAISITPTTLTRLNKNQNVTMDVLGKIYCELGCNIGNIVEYIDDDTE